MTAFRTRTLTLATVALFTAATAAFAADTNFDSGRWRLEQGTAEPSYAATEPLSSTVNLDAVVLACESADTGSRPRHLLQLQLYTTDGGPLRPRRLGAEQSRQLTDEPQARLAIDGQAYPVTLMFGDSYVVVVDSQVDGFAALSRRLQAALQAGHKLTLGFDLVANQADEAVVDLRSAGAQAAIRTMRQCAETPVAPRRPRRGAALPATN
ncbi:MAG: hypothetical protein U1E23_06280 [Reyranellaceae bacterium]